MPGKQYRKHESLKHAETQAQDATPDFGDNFRTRWSVD